MMHFPTITQIQVPTGLRLEVESPQSATIFKGCLLCSCLPPSCWFLALLTCNQPYLPMADKSNRQPEIYPLDPAVQEILHIKTFQEKFDIKDFISGISEKLIQSSNEEAGRAYNGQVT